MKTSTIKSILAVAVFLAICFFQPSPRIAAEGIVSGNSGEYGLNLELTTDVTSSPQDPDGGCITSGETKSGTIFPAGDTDPFTFYGQADQGVVIKMADTVSGTLYPRLQLYDPNGELVAGADDCFWHNGFVSIENYQLKEKGIYTIVADGCGLSTGEYGLSLVLAPGVTTSPQDPDGSCIASGETKSGTIFSAADTDPFIFYGQAGQGVVIKKADTASGTLYPRLQLYDPNGELVAAADDCFWHNGFVSIENYQLEKTGFYTIVAGGCGLSTGEYGLSLVLAPGATTSPQDPDGDCITSGETRSGTIFPAGDTDPFKFYGQAGQGVVIKKADTASGTLYPRLQLYDPNGELVAAADDCFWHNGFVSIENYQLEKTGFYTIVADGCGLSTGEYGLSLDLMPPIDPCGVYPYDPQPADGNSVTVCGGDTLGWWSVNGATQYDISFYVGPCMTHSLNITKFITTLENARQDVTRIHVPMPALDANEVYYWQVVAYTPNEVIKGPIWWFATEPCPDCNLTLSAIGQGSIEDLQGSIRDPNVEVHFYPCGEVVPVTAVADPNYEFVRWEGTAVDANKTVVEYQDYMGSTIQVTVDGAYTLMAIFEEIIYDFPLDSDPGWILEGQWEFGMPTGQGGNRCGNPDPNSGYTGTNVFGVNLNGDYDVDVGPLYSLLAGPFDLRGYSDVSVRFARWLNTDEPHYVTASVDVSTDGENWGTVWESETAITDSQWVPVERPLGAEADGQSEVYLRWTYQVVGERAYPCSGWNLDDIRLIGRR